MRTLSRIGLAAAAALALTPAARPCDPGSYDPKDDAPRAQVCDPDEPQRHAPAEAERAPAREQAASRVVEDASLAGSGSGTGSGATAAVRSDTSSPYDDAPRSW